MSVRANELPYSVLLNVKTGVLCKLFMKPVLNFPCGLFYLLSKMNETECVEQLNLFSCNFLTNNIVNGKETVSSCFGFDGDDSTEMLLCFL